MVGGMHYHFRSISLPGRTENVVQHDHRYGQHCWNNSTTRNVAMIFKLLNSRVRLQALETKEFLKFWLRNKTHIYPYMNQYLWNCQQNIPVCDPMDDKSISSYHMNQWRTRPQLIISISICGIQYLGVYLSPWYICHVLFILLISFGSSIV